MYHDSVDDIASSLAQLVAIKQAKSNLARVFFCGIGRVRDYRQEMLWLRQEGIDR